MHAGKIFWLSEDGLIGVIRPSNIHFDDVFFNLYSLDISEKLLLNDEVEYESCIFKHGPQAFSIKKLKK